MSILKSLLCFFWFLPYLYMSVDTYFILDNRISSVAFKYLVLISFCCSVLLVMLWYKEFSAFYAINTAFKALKNDNLNLLDKILSKYSIANFIKNGKTLLDLAIVEQKDPDIVSYLLSKKARVFYEYDDLYNLSYTLFYLSSYYNYVNEQMINYLLNQGADINFIDSTKGFKGLSLLQVLVLRENKSAIYLLLERGADIRYNIPDIHMDALMLASKYSEDPFIIKLLIEHGAYVNKINQNGYCAILYAAEFNPNPAIIKMLVNYGAIISNYIIKESILKEQDVTPLFLASSYNNVEVVKKLISLGDDVNYINNEGISIIFVASANNTSIDVIKALLAGGVDLDQSKDKNGNTALMVASYLNSNPNLIRYLIERTHNLQAKNSEGFDFIDYLKENDNLNEEEKNYVLNKWLQ